MTGEEIQKMQTTYTMQSWSKQKGLKPIPVERSEGIYFYDTDGKRYADMSSQQVNVNLGYGNKAIGDAIKAKVDKYCYIGPSFGDEDRAKLGIDHRPAAGYVRQGVLHQCRRRCQ